MAVYTLTLSSTTLPRRTLPTTPLVCVGRVTQPASALINRAGEDVQSSNDTPQSRGLALHLGREMDLSSRADLTLMFHPKSPPRTSDVGCR
jgi:hypothetical protein